MDVARDLRQRRGAMVAGVVMDFSVVEIERRLREAGCKVTAMGTTDINGAAAICGVTKRTLYDWQENGKGPPYYKLHTGATVYNIAEVAGWFVGRLEAQEDCELVQSATFRRKPDVVRG